MQSKNIFVLGLVIIVLLLGKSSLQAFAIDIAPGIAYGMSSYDSQDNDESQIIPNLEIQLPFNKHFYGALGVYYTKVNMGTMNKITQDFSSVALPPSTEDVNLNIVPLYFALNYEANITKSSYLGGYVRGGFLTEDKSYYSHYDKDPTTGELQNQSDAYLKPTTLMGLGLFYAYKNLYITAFYDVIRVENHLSYNDLTQSQEVGKNLTLSGIRLSYLFSYNSKS